MKINEGVLTIRTNDEKVINALIEEVEEYSILNFTEYKVSFSVNYHTKEEALEAIKELVNLALDLGAGELDFRMVTKMEGKFFTELDYELDELDY